MNPQEIEELVLVTERNHAALVRLVRELQRENAELRQAIYGASAIIHGVHGDAAAEERIRELSKQP